VRGQQEIRGKGKEEWEEKQWRKPAFAIHRPWVSSVHSEEPLTVFIARQHTDA